MPYCTKCEEELPKDGNFVYCFGCESNLHYRCTTIGESTYSRMGKARKEEWRCELCRLDDISKKNVSKTVDSNITSVLHEIKTSIKGLSEQIRNCVAAQALITQQYEELREKQDQLFKATSSFESKLNELTTLISVKDEKINELTILCRTLEQESRNHEVVIYGVLQKEKESIYDIISNIGKKLDVNILPSDIEASYRMRQPASKKPESAGGNPPPISVRFTSLAKRNEVLKKKKAISITNGDIVENGLDGKVYINEMMTTYFKKLWGDVRTQARISNWKYVWFKDGKIKAKKQDKGKTIVISTMDDVSKLV